MKKYSMDVSGKEVDFLNKFKKKVLQVYPGRIKSIVLFGSRATGKARRDSDFDIFIMVDNRDRYLVDGIFDIAYDIQIQSDLKVDISPVIMSEEFLRTDCYRNSESPWKYWKRELLCERREQKKEYGKGLEPKSHEGVSHYFNINFVREGLFSHEQNRFFKKLMKYRHEADYGLGYEITVRDCNEWYEKVAEFMREVRNYMKDY